MGITYHLMCFIPIVKSLYVMRISRLLVAKLILETRTELYALVVFIQSATEDKAL